jgi:hypothetical protein
MADDEDVQVPRWALKFVLDNADTCDRGPAGAGWSSDKMREAVKALQQAKPLGFCWRCDAPL